MSPIQQGCNNETSLQGIRHKKNSTVGNFLNTMKKGLRAASAAHAYPYDKDAMLRILSEDK